MVTYSKMFREKMRGLGKCTSCAKNPISPNSVTRCEACLEKRRREAKVYREANVQKVNQAKYKWAREHVERVKEIRREVNLRRKDKAFQESNLRRARKNKVGGSFSKLEWEELQESYGNICISCGSNIRMEADHVIPISKGGVNSIDNIQPLCLKCNRSKGTKIIDFRPFGRAILDWT